MDLRAVIFVPALVGAIIFGFVFLLFAAHYYLNVLESTGAGAKEVTWVSEPILDNAWKVVYLIWLVGLWLGPAYFIGRAMTAGTETAWLRLAIPLVVIWICYPISQLSSLSASTIWLPLVPDVLVRLAQKPAIAFGFYLLSAGVLAVFGLALKWTFLTAGDWQLLFIGAPLLILAGLLYARLIGRLAFALRFTTGLFPAKKKKKLKAEAKPEPAANDEVMPTIRQPEDLPPINTVEGELTGYNVLMEDDAPKPPKKRVRAEAVEPDVGPEKLPVPLPHRAVSEQEEDNEVATPYEMRPAATVPNEELPEDIVQPRADEMALLDRSDAPRKPKRVWGPDLLAFLAQPGTISAIVIASGLCVMAGVMVRVARAFNPADSG